MTMIPEALDAIPDFRNHLPIRIRFGTGCLLEVPDALAELGVSRPMLLIDPNLAEQPAGRRVVEVLTTRFPSTTVLNGPAGEPTAPAVEAAQIALDGCDSLVAVGGGSVLDTAKAARVLQTEECSVRDFHSLRPSRPPTVPLIAIPSTAGSGSEVSGGAVILDPAEQRKIAIASPLMRAQYAYVDPELTYGLPPGPTKYGGVDALAQAIAAIVVTAATPIGDAIALEAVRMAAAALPVVVENGADREARRVMACASLMAGLAMNISECGSEHSLAHPLGSRYGIPHGLSVGLVLAETMDHDRTAVPDRFERIADALRAPANGNCDGSRAVTAIERLLAKIDFPTLSDLSVPLDGIDRLTDDALRDWIPVAPARWGREDVETAYRRAFGRASRTERPTELVHGVRDGLSTGQRSDGVGRAAQTGS